MKNLLLCLALLIGLADGSILVFGGSPRVDVTPTEITIDGTAIPIDIVKAFRFVPDSAVM